MVPGMDDRLEHAVPDHSYQPAEAGSWNIQLRAAGEHAEGLQPWRTALRIPSCKTDPGPGDSTGKRRVKGAPLAGADL